MIRALLDRLHVLDVITVFARVTRCEQDLDCDCDGSIAESLEALRQQVLDLRACVHELMTDPDKVRS